MGGSFDSRERVQEIKQRHMQAQIPASKIMFKKSGNNSKIGTIQKESTQPQYVYGDNNFSSNSNEDSQERMLGVGGKRLLTQPEKGMSGRIADPRDNSRGDSEHGEIQVIRNVGPLSKTKQPSYANPSKRLSQQASARQFQQNAGYQANNRKLVQNNRGGPSDQMAYRQMEDSRNNQMYGQGGNHYASIGNQSKGKVITIGAGHQRNLSHSGNNRPGAQAATFYGNQDQFSGQITQMKLVE